MGLHQTKKLQHNKEKHQQNEKATHCMLEHNDIPDKGLISKIY